jgi:hypothetical protein
VRRPTCAFVAPALPASAAAEPVQVNFEAYVDPYCAADERSGCVFEDVGVDVLDCRVAAAKNAINRRSSTRPV